MGSTKNGAKAAKRKEHSEVRDAEGGVKSSGHKKKHVESKAAGQKRHEGENVAQSKDDGEIKADGDGVEAHKTGVKDGVKADDDGTKADDNGIKADNDGIKADGPGEAPESRANERVKRSEANKASSGDRPPAVSSIADVPVTAERRPFVQADDKGRLPHAGSPRATQAATAQRPEGTTQGGRHQNQTVLQQHVEFFDQDRDGVIWPVDTYRGFYALGYGIVFSLVAAVVINGAFSYPTLAGYLPDPLFRIYVGNIHRDKHGSDSGAYDNEGRFVPQKFDDIFSKYAEGRDYVTARDVVELLRGQRLVADPFGWFGAFFEWLATYLLLWPADGRMAKEDIRGVYDGSIFYTIASRRQQSKKRG